MTEELKPCPFCGGEAELDCSSGYAFGEYGESHAVFCKTSENMHSVGWFNKRAEAIAAWNTRPSHPGFLDWLKEQEKRCEALAREGISGAPYEGLGYLRARVKFEALLSALPDHEPKAVTPAITEEMIIRAERAFHQNPDSDYRMLHVLQAALASPEPPQSGWEQTMDLAISSLYSFLRIANGNVSPEEFEVIQIFLATARTNNKRGHFVAPQDGWRDIETAPKDKTVDLWCYNEHDPSEKMRIADCHWTLQSNWKNEEFEGWFHHAHSLAPEGPLIPTHWQIVAPPEGGR